MLRLKKVAVTGSIASGKSSVSQIFRELGAYVVSADNIVHHLLDHDSQLIKQLESLLGSGILNEGKISRRAIAKKIFKDTDLRKQVEALIHPLVRKEVLRALQEAETKGTVRLFVAEIPLFFESGLETMFDLSIAVTAPRELRLRRFLEKTSLTEEEFNERESVQLPEEEKAKRSSFVIENNKSLSDLREEVIKLQLTH